MKRRALWLTLAVFVALCSGVGWWLNRERQQDVRNQQLIAALIRDDTKTALALVNEGADPNTHLFDLPAPTFKSLFNQLLHRSQPPVNDSPTAFLIACGSYTIYPDYPTYFSEDVQLVQAMLAHGANLKARLFDNRTALHAAVLEKRQHTVELLLQKGAKVDAKDSDLSTPLMCAVSYRRDKRSTITRLLLSYGANPNVHDLEGWTPLMHAASDDNVEGVRLLLKHGADVEAHNMDGWTPLYVAVNSGSESRTVLELLKHRADSNVQTRWTHSLLTLAKQFKRPDLVRLLKQYGAK